MFWVQLVPDPFELFLEAGENSLTAVMLDERLQADDPARVHEPRHLLGGSRSQAEVDEVPRGLAGGEQTMRVIWGSVSGI